MKFYISNFSPVKCTSSTYLYKVSKDFEIQSHLLFSPGSVLVPVTGVEFVEFTYNRIERRLWCVFFISPDGFLLCYATQFRSVAEHIQEFFEEI